ncbi:uncharacterized protein LOC133830924 isoform X2 [Humulus lupulus]|uniref:uncharacterized protein LOC133830924 isoform X2 n=1 Tax=Humulus lupulus TaxID=3486 RepID=UPI002B40CC03|nr:uncharacterized protein LOC133830924 isoform X2 [Humulus lupulus]
MPVLTETSTMAEHIKLRRPRSQFGLLISETDPNPLEIPSIIQSTRCKSTISSLLLSTFSTNNNTNAITTNSNETIPLNLHNKKKNNFTSSTFRGLGCTAGSSQQVSVPAVIRSSADWQGKKVRKKKQKNSNSNNNNGSKNSNGNKESEKDRNALHQGLVDGSNSVFNSASCVDFQDVWCGPGIGFSADAAASVDCVVARRNVSGRGKIDGDKMTSGHRDRERSYIARRTVTPEPSFFDTEPNFLLERPGSEVFGARYFRHVRHPSPEGLAEIMMLHSGLLMGNRVDIHDRFRDMRLDVDNMSYEELLDLGERIGYVNTGLKEEEIGRCLRKIKLSISNDWSRLPSLADKKCSICQEEFETDDDMGKLDCGHGFHTECIRHWLSHKNTCPVCKAEAVARS